MVFGMVVHTVLYKPSKMGTQDTRLMSGLFGFVIPDYGILTQGDAY